MHNISLPEFRRFFPSCPSIGLGDDFFMYREEMIFSVTMLFPMAAAILDLMAAKRIMTDEFILKSYKKSSRR